jgi:hypothetical protein
LVLSTGSFAIKIGALNGISQGSTASRGDNHPLEVTSGRLASTAKLHVGRSP